MQNILAEIICSGRKTTAVTSVAPKFVHVIHMVPIHVQMMLPRELSRHSYRLDCEEPDQCSGGGLRVGDTGSEARCEASQVGGNINKANEESSPLQDGPS